MLKLILVLTPFVFSFALGLDIYIPILPQIARIFNTTPTMAQLTMSLFLLMTGIGQIVIGPLSDRWGRKPIFYLSTVFYALGSLGSAFSPTIEWLIVNRVISGLGACGMLVTAFALVRDLYSSEESAKMFSYLNGAIGISPTFAPILGGYLALYWGWRSVFVFLVILGLVSFLIALFFIEETNIRKTASSAKSYYTILCNRQFITYALLAGLAESVFFCFFSISPFIIIGVHGIPTEEFGYYFAAFGSVIGIGGFASGKLIDKKGIPFTIQLGIGAMLLGGLSMLFCHLLFPPSLSGFLIPMALACFGSMCVLGGAASLALEPFGDIAGTASAAFGAFEFGLSAAVGSLLMLFSTDSPLAYSLFILSLALLSVALVYQRLPYTQVGKIP